MQPEEFTLDYFLKVGVLTGSRAFGVAKPDSDWDIIIEESMFRIGPMTNFSPYALEPWTAMCDYHVCIDFESEPGSDDADGFDDAEYVPTDDSRVWGQELLRIVKIWNNEEDESECINLFIYENNTSNLFDKFNQVNNLMNFTLTKEQLADRDTRVNQFIKCMQSLGISS